MINMSLNIGPTGLLLYNKLTDEIINPLTLISDDRYNLFDEYVIDEWKHWYSLYNSGLFDIPNLEINNLEERTFELFEEFLKIFNVLVNDEEMLNRCVKAVTDRKMLELEEEYPLSMVATMMKQYIIDKDHILNTIKDINKQLRRMRRIHAIEQL